MNHRVQIIFSQKLNTRDEAVPSPASEAAGVTEKEEEAANKTTKKKKATAPEEVTTRSTAQAAMPTVEEVIEPAEASGLLAESFEFHSTLGSVQQRFAIRAQMGNLGILLLTELSKRMKRCRTATP